MIAANTNWRVRWLAYGESRMERMRSMISTSVTYNPVSEAIESNIVDRTGVACSSSTSPPSTKISLYSPRIHVAERVSAS